MFKIGQKVVFKGPLQYDPYPGVTMPVPHEIYTVRSIFYNSVRTGLLLEEIVNPIMSWMDGTYEPGFDYKDFRPIDYAYGRSICESLEVMTEPELV